MQGSEVLRHSNTDMPGRIPVAAFPEDQRIGFAHLFDRVGGMPAAKDRFIVLMNSLAMTA